MKLTSAAIVLTLTLPVYAAPPATTQSAQSKLESLRVAALGNDLDASMAAVRELDALGEPAAAQLVGILRQLMERDRQALDRAFAKAGDGTAFERLFTEIDTLRAAALDNIDHLAKGDKTLPKAHEYYVKLADLQEKLTAGSMPRIDILDGIHRRAEFQEIYRKRAPADEQKGGAIADAALAVKLEKVIGPDLWNGGKPLLGPPDLQAPPFGGAKWCLWQFRASRRIEAYNASLAARLLDPGETQFVTIMNDYRESLGLLPLELDPRLVQSARKHSKEMVDLKYFRHDSPTPALRDVSQRVDREGYPYSTVGENIQWSKTRSDAKGVFNQWFDSPPHHQNMANASYTAMGIGRWSVDHTLNLASGPRLMLAREVDREAVMEATAKGLGAEK